MPDSPARPSSSLQDTPPASPRGAWTVALNAAPVDAPVADHEDEARAPSAGVLATGTALPPYEILGVLGRGGFGITYRARDGRSGREVAVKEFFPLGCARRFDPDGSWAIYASPSLGASAFEIARAQFIEGGRALSRLRHPALARVWEIFEAHGSAYLVMELLQGQTLQEHILEHGPFDEEAALVTIAALGEAASALHRLEFLHLDIKPENAMLCPAASIGEDASTSTSTSAALGGRIVLFDFDLLQRIERADGLGTRPLTAHCGTPGYAPLEQYAQHATLGRFSDVYALGATLLYLLGAQDPPAAADRALSRTLLDPQLLRPGLSEAAASSIAWAMEVLPDARPASVEEWLPSLKTGRPQPQASTSTPAAPAVDDSDAAFLANAPLAPTANSLAGFSSISGVPSLPTAAPALPALPIVDSWHQIVANADDYDWPVSCACCGRRPDVGLNIRAGRDKWNVPYCARCSRHVKAAHQASIGTVWGIVGGLAVAFLGWALSDFWIGPIGVAIHFSALAYGALKVQAAEALMRPRCCDRKHAVGFGGVRETRAGRKYLVRFRSLRYAHEWKDRNASKL
jgi:serine/threonine-protein kinase